MARTWTSKGGRSRRGAREPLLPDGPRSAGDVEAPPQEQQEQQQAASAGVGRLLREARPEALTLTVATAFLFVGSLAQLAVPKIAGNLIDTCTQAASGGLPPGAARAALDRQLLLVLVILAVGGLASGLRAFLFNAVAERVMCRLRVKLFSRLCLQDVAFFDATPVGELSNRLAEDTRAMKDAATTSISMALRSLVTSVLGAVMMFLTSWRLALLTVGCLPPMLLMFRTFARLNKKYVTAQLTSAAAASATAQEVLAGIRTVKSFAKEGYVIGKYSDAAANILSWGIKSAVASGVFVGTAIPFAYSCMMVVLWYGSVLVLQGAMSVGDLNAFMLYAVFVAGSAGGLAGTAAQVIAAVGAGRRVFQLIDRQPQLPPCGNERPVGSPAGAALAFVNVSFAYPTRRGTPVLQDFNLQVAPGQTVALVGNSGGGKTTVMKLVQRFYDCTSGAVLLDGVRLELIDNLWLHQAVALVAQEPLVFADSIRANIVFGVHRPVSEEEVEEAARQAHAHEFISALPQGYDSRVGEAGVMLSGGQKQRLAIARALLCQPRLLCLDEATSALDAESEHLVQQALQEAARSRTVVVIAHRLSTVSGADLVAVISGGRVVEQGTHGELMAVPGGAYAQLVARQVFSGEARDAAEPAAAAAAAAVVVEDGAADEQAAPAASAGSSAEA